MILYTDIDPFCCKVLRARVADGGLPKGDVLEKDIREITADDLAGYRQIHLFAGIGGFGLAQKWAGWPENITLVTGGFPCQDISSSGPKAGAHGERSGLWVEAARIIRRVGPDYTIMENVSDLLSRGAGDVLGGLAEIGYDAEWHCIPASFVGAPQARERIWIVAYPNNRGCDREPQWNIKGPVVVLRDDDDRLDLGQSGARNARAWVRRADDGVPRRVDRLKSLGNAIVPQVAEVIMRQMSGACQ